MHSKNPLEICMVSVVLLGFLIALVSPFLYRVLRDKTGWTLGFSLFALMIYFLTYLTPVANGEVVVDKLGWVPSLGINLSFQLDGLSLLFALLISGIGALIFIYAGDYLRDHPQLGRFYGFLSMFTMSMLGMVLADNLLAFFVFWELTSITSYLLIGFDHQRAAVQRAALQALLVTAFGGLAMLVGLLMLGQVAGSLAWSTLFTDPDRIRADPLYPAILFLILIGAFTKSAQFPFHFWLPAAMEAPTPVSAYLHSATMVKAGIYLLARMSPIFGGTELWFYTVSSVGAITMLLGAWLAFQQTDLKRVLAYSTISALGILTLLLGLGTPPAVKAALTFLVAHALYKGALFLIAGGIDHATGSRDIDRLGNLRHTMPVTAFAAFLATLSMAGLPPFLGFYAKEMVLASLYEQDGALLLVAGGVVTSTFFVAVAVLTGLKPFFGKRPSTPREPHGELLSLWLPPLLLTVTGLLIGVFPYTVDVPLLLASAQATLQEPTTLHLTLWHGLNPAVIFSLAALAGGAILLLIRRPLLQLIAPLRGFSGWGPERLYAGALQGLNWSAQVQTRVLQNGYLRYYLLTILLSLIALVGYKLRPQMASMSSGLAFDVYLYEWVLTAVILLAAVSATIMRSRLAAVAALGVVGYGVAVIYVLFGAPDLAMTQFMIETLSVILFVFVFYHLPPFAMLSRSLTRWRDTLVALAAGGLISAIVLLATGISLSAKISNYFAEQSLIAAHGRNIVNVILVDFRALDTLGEITVLALAGIGVYALLKLRSGNSK